MVKSVDKKLRALVKKPFSPDRLGASIPVVRKLSAQEFKKVSDLSKREIFSLCDELISHGTVEHKTVGFDWSLRLRKFWASSDFKYFKRWSKKDILDWIDCDDLATHGLGQFLCDFPEHLTEMRKMTLSKKWQVRRMAAVCLVHPIRQKKYLRETFMTVNELLGDEHELVQKGYAWLLKEASHHYPGSVKKYLEVHKDDMPKAIWRRAGRAL